MTAKHLQLSHRIKFLVIFMLSAIILNSTETSAAESSTGPDKTAHAVGSLLFSGATYAYLRGKKWKKPEAFMGSFVLTLTLGIAKETFDSKASSKDIAADGIGALSGSLITLVFDF